MAGIYLGSTDLADATLYGGSNSVTKAYIGSNEVWTAPLPIVTSGLDHFFTTLDAASWPGSGNNWNDLIATNAVTLVKTAGVGVTTYGGYTAFDFDAAGDNMVGSMSYTKTYTALTVEAWIWYDGGQITAQDKGLISQFAWNAATQNTVTYHTIGTSGTYDSKQQAYISFASSNRGHHPADTAVTIDSWQHVAVTLESGTTNNLIFYTNGSPDGTDSVPNTGFSVSPGASQVIRVGQEQNNERQYSGGIAVLRWYDRALSAAEILQNYNAGIDAGM